MELSSPLIDMSLFCISVCILDRYNYKGVMFQGARIDRIVNKSLSH